MMMMMMMMMMIMTVVVVLVMIWMQRRLLHVYATDMYGEVESSTILNLRVVFLILLLGLCIV
jgi:hypothetical protein